MANKKIIITISSITAIVIIVLILYLAPSSQENEPLIKKVTEINLIKGDWLRTDAGYLIRINTVNENGTIDANYFNPKAINVESANWEDSYGDLKIFIVLRDANYPGSKYTLNYLPDRDMLAGEYYQAVQGLTFYVEFMRKK